MTLGMLSWAANLLLVLSLVLVLLDLLRTGSPALDALAAAFSAGFWISLIVFVVGKVGLLAPLPLLILSLFLFATLMLVKPTRESLLRGADHLFGLIGHGLDRWRQIPRWLRLALVMFVALNAARFLFLIWALPPFVWDSLTYHLTNVAHWIQAGRIELFETSMARIYTPANYELLAAWFTVFLHHDFLIEASGLPAYVIALMAVYATSRNLGASVNASLLGALSFGTFPGLLLAVTGTKNDPHMTAYYLALLALVVHMGQARQSEGQSLSLVSLVGMIVLLAAGTKAYIAHLLPGLVAVAILVPGPRTVLRQWGGVLSSAWREFLSADALRQWVVVGLLASGIVLGGYWNVRNWILTGNPFYPYGVAIEGTEVVPRGDRMTGFGTTRLEENLASLIDRFGDSEGPIQPDLPNSTGWGWFVYSMGLPATVWSLVRRRSVWPVVVGFGVSYLLLMMSTRPSPWNMRYVIWFPAIFSIAFALFWDAVPARGFIKSFIAALLGATMSLNVVMVLNYNRVPPEKFQLMIERSVWERHAAVLKLNIPSEYENAIRYVPRDATLGYNVHSNGFIYPMYRADYSQRLVYIPFEPDESCETIASRMEAGGTRYLLVAPEHSLDENIAKLRECANEGSVIRERARGLYVVKRES